MREEASFRMFFEKVKESKRKLEIDDPELPQKKTFREFVSTVEEHSHQNFYLSRYVTLKLFRQWKYCL